MPSAQRPALICGSEEFLTLFCKKLAAPDCVFSTYASRGDYDGLLIQQGFRVFLRQGFQGKRQSTYAVRGNLPIPPLIDIQKFIALMQSDGPAFTIQVFVQMTEVFFKGLLRSW